MLRAPSSRSANQAAELVSRGASAILAGAGGVVAGWAAWYSVGYFLGRDSLSDGAAVVGFFAVLVTVPLALLCVGVLGAAAWAMWRGRPFWLLWAALTMSLPPLIVSLVAQPTNSGGLTAKVAVLVVTLAALIGSSARLVETKFAGPAKHR